MEIPLQLPPSFGEKRRFGRYNLPCLHTGNVYNPSPFHEQNVSPQGSPREEEACVTDSDLGFFIGDRYFFHGGILKGTRKMGPKPIVINGGK